MVHLIIKIKMSTVLQVNIFFGMLSVYSLKACYLRIKHDSSSFIYDHSTSSYIPEQGNELSDHV